MPIPLLFIGIGLGTAALGIGKGVKASIDQKDANNTNAHAQSIVDDATTKAATSRKNSCKAIEDLGRKKIWVLDNSVETFIHLFEQLHNVELGASSGMDELKKFRIDKQAFGELKQMSAMASSIAGGLVGGAAAGALAAIGAYGGAMCLCHNGDCNRQPQRSGRYQCDTGLFRRRRTLRGRTGNGRRHHGSGRTSCRTRLSRHGFYHWSKGKCK